MDVVLIFGGLGNQMSQYAFYLRKKSINSNTYYVYDRRTKGQHTGYDLERPFNIQQKHSLANELLFLLYTKIITSQRLSEAFKARLGTIGMRVISEKQNYDFEQSNFELRTGVNFFCGGWHSEKNFMTIRESIKNAFRFTDTPNEKPFGDVLSSIRSTESVSIHVRRGDYLKPTDSFYQFSDVATLDYYHNAVTLIREKVHSPAFFVFSDDLNWCKAELKLENANYVDCNRGANSWRDMMLMSNCKHNINANSTFSWWGAWLNSNPDKIVIAPKFFIRNVVTKDLYPDDWVKI